MTKYLIMDSWLATAVVAYIVGRIGVPTLYQDVKHFIQKVVALVKGTKTVTA